jgi:glycosyltransferase involved in cell wall biosynthesis
MKKTQFSVLILTYNEQKNIAKCLESVAFSDDVVVVDSFSTDQTTNIIGAFENVKILQNKFTDFASQRNFGLDSHEFLNEIVIHLDADEILTPEFIKELSQVDFNKFDVVDCPSRIIFDGKWLKYSTGYPVYQSRIAKKHVRFYEHGHGQKISNDYVKTRMSTPYDHYNFSHGLPVWFIKHVKYARKEARNFKSQTLVSGPLDRRWIYSAVPMIARPFARFVYQYIFKQGFRDGKEGFRYCLMILVYELMIYIMYNEVTPHDHVEDSVSG